MNQERKNKLMAMTLAGLSLLTIGVYSIDPNPTIEVNRDLFKVENLNEIDKVTLQSKTSSITLDTDGYRWRVNNRYNADASMIKVLFATLLQFEPQRPVASSLKDSISRMIESNGILVTLFSSGTPVKSFYAGGNSSKTQAYFKDQESGEIYLMNIPGYRVYVSGIFELNESGFRNKHVFDFEWRNFKSMKVVFPDRPGESFSVSYQKNYFGIEGEPKADTARLNTFLDQVSLLTVDEYINQLPAEAGRPMMEIIIADIANRNYNLRLFSGNNRGRIPGIMGNQAALFDEKKIQPIVRPKSFFIKK